MSQFIRTFYLCICVQLCFLCCITQWCCHAFNFFGFDDDFPIGSNTNRPRGFSNQKRPRILANVHTRSQQLMDANLSYTNQSCFRRTIANNIYSHIKRLMDIHHYVLLSSNERYMINIAGICIYIYIYIYINL